MQRENKMLDYDLARNNAQPQSVSAKVSTMNLNRMQSQNNRNGKLASIAAGSLSVNSRGVRNITANKPNTISASVDLTGRLGGGRFNTL